MKYIVINDDYNYPSILVLGTLEEAEIVFKALVQGYEDYDGDYRTFEGNTQMVVVENTDLTTVDWTHVSYGPIAELVEFL